jgi:HPt (histidine-containing phosphotransfer) domain-containing protein
MAFVRAAHVIKGAASNLMCEQLRTTAMGLESAAQAAFGGEHERSVVLEGVIKKLEGLKVAVKNYHDYLKEIGV